ncbi:MAG: hypothetical protein ACK5PZ_16340 [Pirellula sp.]
MQLVRVLVATILADDSWISGHWASQQEFLHPSSVEHLLAVLSQAAFFLVVTELASSSAGVFPSCWQLSQGDLHFNGQRSDSSASADPPKNTPPTIAAERPRIRVISTNDAASMLASPTTHLMEETLVRRRTRIAHRSPGG